jgi:hypothetical protein
MLDVSCVAVGGVGLPWFSGIVDMVLRSKDDNRKYMSCLYKDIKYESW